MTKKKTSRRAISLIFYENRAIGDGRKVACAGSEIDFVGPDLEPSYEKDAREALAKQVCSGCDLRAECLLWATQNYQVGVWGGTNDDERKAFRASRSYRHKGAPVTKQQHDRQERELIAWAMHKDGATNQEVAVHLGITAGTVYTYIRDQRRTHEARAKEAAEAGQGHQADEGSSDRIESGPDRPAETIRTSKRELVAGGRA